jgi:hypothetical protein
VNRKARIADPMKLEIGFAHVEQPGNAYASRCCDAGFGVWGGSDSLNK